MTDETTSKLREWLWDHPFMQVGGSSMDGFLFIKIYGNRHYDKPWFKATVMPVYHALRAVHRAKWWVNHRFVPKHRYHVVKTDLKPGYYDDDTLLLHSAMACLCRHVECEGGAEALAAFSDELRRNPDPNAPADLESGQAGRQDEAVAIYRWWKVQKPADEKRRDAMLMILYGNGGDNLEFVPVPGKPLYEVVIKEFGGDKKRMHTEFRALEDKIDADEQAMLHRLVNIRRSLWT